MLVFDVKRKTYFNVQRIERAASSLIWLVIHKDRNNTPPNIMSRNTVRRIDLYTKMNDYFERVLNVNPSSVFAICTS